MPANCEFGIHAHYTTMKSKIITKDGVEVEKIINDTGHVQYREVGMHSSSPDLAAMLQNDRHIRLVMDGKTIAVLNLNNGVNVFISDDNISNIGESGKSELSHRLGNSDDECYIKGNGGRCGIHIIFATNVKVHPRARLNERL